MKSTLLALLLLFLSTSVFSQKSAKQFYKDKWMSKPTTEKKAKYYEIISLEDGVKTKELYSVADDKLLMRKSYKGDVPTGLWEDHRGSRKVTMDYRFELKYFDNGSVQKPKSDESVAGDITEPEFPGGIQAFYSYVGKTMRYPAHARRHGIQGAVKVQINITKKGKVQFLSIYEGIHESLDLEAARVMTQCPNWIPAKQDGKPIERIMVFPLYFKLAN